MGLDVVITNGWIVDGSGGPRHRADIGIRDDRIVSIGRVDTDAALAIDADGLIVAPGFVDPHSHTDWTLHANRDAHSTIRQGVTTEIVGNCGISNAPISAGSLTAATARLRAHGYEHPPAWRMFGDYLADVEAGGTAQNLGFLVGHSTIREAAGVASAEPSEQQLARMEALVREAMEAGALGMSSGLEYSYGAFAGTDELRRLAMVVGAYGGLYASHVRNRDEWILDSIEEFLSIVRAGNVAGQISHLNVRHDTNAPDRAWAKAVELMSAGRVAGLDVQADMTPFRHGIGAMTGLLPGWLLADGYGAAAQRLADPLVRAKLRGDCDRYWRFVHKGQWHRVRLQNSPQFPELDGLTFDEIARQRKQDEWDCYFDILAAAGDGMDNLTLVGELFTDEHLAEMLTHPLFSLGVDSYTSIDHGPLSELTANPLPYSGHVHYLTHHVRANHTLSLEEAVRKMSALPAFRFGLHGRGLLRPGYYADVVIFDFEALNTRSTFADPAHYPDGVRAVLVNGALAVDRGTHTGRRAGRVLRRVA